MTDDPNARAARLAAVLEDHGGPMEFVRQSGLNKQRVYGALKGAESLPVYAEVLRLYPDVDARWLMCGVATPESHGRDCAEPPHHPDAATLGSRVDALVRALGPDVESRMTGYLDGLEVALRRRP